ncbi:MAG: MBL fold metallo-hydrolase [Desulfobacterales bacterium]
MTSTKRIICIVAMMIVILGPLTISVSAEPCYPSTPLEAYTMQYLTRTVPGIGLLQTSPGMHVILAGTGQPWYDSIRNPQSIAVIAGGKFLLFDTGDGCTKTLDKLNLPINLIDNVFLTHYHSDHTSDLGQLINHTWVNGRQQPIHVYGPENVQDLTKGFAEAAKLDIDIRAGALETLDPELAVGVPHEFIYPEDGSPVEIYSENGVVVKAFKNDHYDVEISVGYRIEYAGRVVVISGDTIYCQSVIDNSAGADLLIHEATNHVMAERAACLAETLLGPQGQSLALRIRRAISHHIDTIEVADVAAQAGVNRLVLTHIIPPIPETFMGVDFEAAFMAGMSEIYTGPIDIVKDADSFYLPPAPSTNINGPCVGPCAP